MLDKLPRATAPVAAAVTVFLAAGAAPASADMIQKTNPLSITVSDNGSSATPVAASPYPSAIEVNGASGVVTDVTVRLNDVSHTNPADMDVMLVGPGDRHVMLMSDHGGTTDIVGKHITFRDDGSAATPTGSGTYRPANSGLGDPVPAGTPNGVYFNDFAAPFEDGSPNGTWRLYAMDDTTGHGGFIAGGWTLSLETGPALAPSAPLTVNDDGAPPSPANPYPSGLAVSGLKGEIEEVVVQLHGLHHNDPADLDIMLQAPNGKTTTLMSDAGGINDITPREVRFDDDAPATIPEADWLHPGSYKPTNNGGADSFPAPAPAQPPTASLAQFAGLDPNGTWKLWVSDDADGGTGGIDGGWDLVLKLRSPIGFATAGSTLGEAAGTQTIIVSRPDGGGPADITYSAGDEWQWDVTPPSGKVEFGPGEKTKAISITPVNDTGHEADEPIELKLGEPSGSGSLTQDSITKHVMTVKDDDAEAIGGDFNGDGRADQAIGIPGEDASGKDGAGAVSVIYGGASGLASAGNQHFTQDTAGVPDLAEAGDAFGAAVASSDFDGDGFSDLAIGAPTENTGAVTDAGLVTILYGSASGLVTTGAMALTQDSPSVPNPGEAGDRFGAALAAANVGRGRHGDLVVGQPGEDVGDVVDAGATTMVFGTDAGLSTATTTYWHQDASGIQDAAETGDAFGSALAAGDLGRTADGDVAIGAPGENGGAGAVIVLYSHEDDGPNGVLDHLWRQDTEDVIDLDEAGDAFGASLSIGPVARSAFGGLAIGVPGEDVGDLADAGAVAVLKTTRKGLTVGGNRLLDQDHPAVSDVAEAGDRFGASVATAEFGDTGQADGTGGDLAVGVPGEDIGGKADAGAVHVIMGGKAFANDTSTLWHQDRPDVLETGEAGDQFGAAVTAARFAGGATDSLAVGVPGEDLTGATDAGAMAVLPPGAGGLSAVADQSWRQGSAGLLDTSGAGDGFGGALLP